MCVEAGGAEGGYSHDYRGFAIVLYIPPDNVLSKRLFLFLFFFLPINTRWHGTKA